MNFLDQKHQGESSTKDFWHALMVKKKQNPSHQIRISFMIMITTSRDTIQ
jgi:hypothetical protein